MRKSTRAAISAAAAAAAVVSGMVLATAGPSSAAPAETHAAAGSGGVRVAYFDQWSIYANAYYLKNVDAIANNLDYILYDFENIDPANLTCFEATKASDTGPTGEQNPNAGDGAGDQFADYQKTFDSSISVDGTSDTWNMPIVGNFHQLQELKARHPNLKVLVSLGGWTYSKYFSDAAATDASRKKFVSSCVDMFIKGNIPAAGGFGGPGTAAGIFDGFDIDWEYPASGAGHLGNHTSPNDTQNFTALLAEFRSQLNAAGSGYKLSAALPGGQDKVAKIETGKIHQYLDFANVMSYDMHGAWDATGPTNFQDPLYPAPNDPSTPIPPGNEKYSIDGIFNAYIHGDPAYGIAGGFPANKLNLGVPFYYRGWTGVAAGANHGLYQAASGPSPGHPMSGNTPGTAMYKELTGLVDNPSTTFFDNTTQSAWFYDGNNFYTGESKQSIKARMDYVHCKGLGGAMMFSLYDLDPASTLFHSVVDGLASTPSSCDGPPPTTTTTTTPPTTTTTTTTPPQSCTEPAWVASQAYTGGAVVSYNGHKWTAKWWTQGDVPGNNSQNVWTDNGVCGGGSTPPAGSCGSVAAWNSTQAYTGGSVVTYNGHKWTAKWWTQGDTPGNNSQGVWTDNGAC
ncbi:glycosyl hydrolase family 18 protein [Labedaea rhizosphaerae]|uniref:chitinase n=1 Tax=Labedaea rhizosphaerae TaxID=598644 RepID=A0A4R6SHA3_LABRH|nr:glycosyl hydrolase family 18 protein [Labedaea rhizosphaerae]TDQ01402.1 chitinase [Labedaea rhizosphaerae]